MASACALPPLVLADADVVGLNRNMLDAYTSTELGEVLLAVSRLPPRFGSGSVSASCTPASPATSARRSHATLVVAVAAALTARLALLFALSPRVADFVGGILLAATAGTCYLALCYLLAACAATKDLGELLLARASPLSWRRERPRLFFEVCSWMASVWYSDFVSAYLRVLEARVSRQQRGTGPERVSWLKAGISYTTVGYLLTENGRILHRYFRADAADSLGIDDLVFNYMLITLVGVSLIVASELLMLHQPTRTAGLILQARIVDSRRNWEERPLRSLLEASATFGATVLSYRASGEVVRSLQLGTLCGTALILSGECVGARRRPLATSAQSAAPADHWIKIAPVAVMMVFFCYQAYSAVGMVSSAPSTTSTVLLWVVGSAASSLTVISLMDFRVVASRFNERAKFALGKGCILGTTLVACRVCHGLPGILFSCYLSWFSVSLSRECWNDIQLKAAARQTRTRLKAPSMDGDEPVRGGVAAFSLSGTLLGYIKRHYPFLFKRTKWTFIAMVIASGIDLCSTLLTLAKLEAFEVTLSQFSAGNVVVSAAVGYLTSSIQQELRPEDLVRTGFVHFKNKWLLFPLQSFIETTVFVGVFLGSFAATSTVFSSLTLAAMSGIVISFGGHWLCSRLQLNDRTSVRVRLTATCSLVFCLVLFSYTSMLALFWIYRYIDSLEATFCLASLAGVVFLAASELFQMWGPTREVGQILQERVTRARDNWLREPLRSFLEIFTWFGVVYGSFALYNDLLLALQLGTFSGIAVTLSGEYFRRNRATLIPWGRGVLVDAEPAEFKLAPGLDTEVAKAGDRPRALPAVLLFAYIGSGTFQWIFENMRSLEMTVVVATIAGIAFLCVADLLVLYKPTRWAGVILQDRVIHVQRNWATYPVRSFVEFGCFLGVIYGSYAIYGDLYVAVQVGTLSGTLVTLIGEQVRSHARVRPVSDDESENEKTQILPLPVMCLLGLVGAVAFNIIYTHLRNIEVTFVLATTSGVLFTLLGDMFVIWKPTRKVGRILQERVLFFKCNFSDHPLRSCAEVAAFAIAWYSSYVCFWPGDLLVAIQFGTLAGISVCVCDELALEYIAEVEHRLVEGLSSRLALDTQKDSGFLSLPYEVQFEIAHFLAPEDLLVARSTCHKVNNMIKAESARFWLHASLRRNLRDRNLHQERSRAHNSHYRMAGQARSLVYEAITLVLPKFVAA
ncbi:hypothetical protein PybrP1_011616, partial [[Pythium] brassicae (nom. inval.)]